MIKELSGIINKAILALSLAIIILPNYTRSQENEKVVPTSTPTVSKTLSPVDEYQNKLGKLTKNPAQFISTLSEFINKYPNSERAVSYFYSLKTVVKNTKNLEEARSLLNQLIKNTELIPTGAKIEAHRNIGDALHSIGYFQDSEEIAQILINIFDETAYVEFKKKQSDFNNAEALAKNPNYKPRPFDMERPKELFVGQKTGTYNLLAKSFWEQSKFEQAEKAYRDSFAVKVTKESALGIAKAAEKNGKNTETLKYATIAALTGKLVPEEMDYFYSVYSKQHQGKKDSIEEYLNAEYKKTYQNPVKSEKYKKTNKRSDRIVLVEFFTGAGCIPCIPFDYTFEKVLEDYSRKEVALLVYHWHAPTLDPLGNHSSDSRVKYYGVNGAPALFVDGKRFGKDVDYNGGTKEQNKIQQTADNVNETLRNNLEVPAEGNLKLQAKRSGRNVSVKVETEGLRNVSDDVTLQIALIENETAYSGENGLRFHFMVVRALAGDEEKRVFGFKVDPANPGGFEYLFDVEKVAAQNLTYYDTESAERMKAFLERMGGKIPEGINIDFKFNYKKNQIDERQLSVIAFLQDNKTKKILQSTVVNLAKN